MATRMISNPRLAVVVTTGLWLAGCSLPQTDECVRYIDCQAHYDELENRQPKNVNMFLAEGVCWESEELSDECTATCVERTYELYELLEAGEDDTGPCVGNPGAE